MAEAVAGSAFQARAAATGNARFPNVIRRVVAYTIRAKRLRHIIRSSGVAVSACCTAVHVTAVSAGNGRRLHDVAA